MGDDDTVILTEEEMNKIVHGETDTESEDENGSGDDAD